MTTSSATADADPDAHPANTATPRANTTTPRANMATSAANTPKLVGYGGRSVPGRWRSARRAEPTRLLVMVIVDV
jgi:hypothetical protein